MSNKSPPTAIKILSLALLPLGSLSLIHGNSNLLIEEEMKGKAACTSGNDSPIPQRGGWIALE